MIKIIKHDNLRLMDDVVSVVTDEREEDIEEIENEQENIKLTLSFSHKLNARYRLMRKNFMSFFRKKSPKYYTNILYITDGTIPREYILALQKQYPEKILTVLVPHFGNFSSLDKAIAGFDYYLQNKQHTAKLYKYPITADNIQVYGIYSKSFSDIENPYDLYKIQNLIHYSTCARYFAKKINNDLIHAENIPFYLGTEFNKNNKKQKVIQTIHNFNVYPELEPFWAAINIMDKQGMRMLCSDKVIKKNLTALFGIKNINKLSQMRECLEYLYKNFERYRSAYEMDYDNNENILIKRLNERTLELFKYAFYLRTFNPVYYSIKNANCCAINSTSKHDPVWTEKLLKTLDLPRGLINSTVGKLAHPFDINNFRFYREYNKQYLVKEFSDKQIKSNFVDLNLFAKQEVKIYGHLDSFYRGILLFAIFDNYKDEDIKTVTNAILKCFELKKNVQVIFKIPKDFNNSYLVSFVDFMEKQPSLEGRWLFIEGNINLPQFVSSSDIILLPSADIIGIENTLYTALKYGCIPVITNEGMCGNIVIDIFDDLKNGFGFKTSNLANESENDKFADALLKSINFYVHNFASWKILIENAMNYDSSWNFEMIEKYNQLYEEV